MKAWIVAVGSEMLTPFRVDTNSLVITEKLNAIGCDVRLKVVVGDDVAELSALFARGIGAVDLIVCTGGLGPTEDDITRDALARAFDLPFETDAAVLEGIRQRFEARGMTMREINKRQAQVPRGAEVLRVIDERLKPTSGSRGLFRRVIKLTGRPESEVDSIAQPVYSRWVNADVPIVTTILAKMGQIELHLTADAPSEAEGHAALAVAVRELLDVLGPSVYSIDGRGLEQVVGDLLRERRMTIAVAESCSGGLLASRLTDVPGSSDYMDRGVVCYSNDAKTELLSVSAALIAEQGAVSEAVAQAMADGVRERARSSVGVGITGIAGPGGGSPDKPVGTVCIAVATPYGRDVRRFAFIGPRDMVKFQSVQAAMNMLRLRLEELPPAGRD